MSFIPVMAAVAGAPGAQPGALVQFLPLIILFVIFYFLLIRPQQQKQKEHEKMLSKLEKNDQVITAGGIHATVVSVADKTASVRIADNVKVEIEKSSILTVVKQRS
ncbi:MAG: Sec translocon accessory complex subunit YajC [Candidatus Omnitrophica bacterium]|nr:Sec translocon accessory complex subunit YajC [Candidatus Omnitrophota bacterium]